MNRTFLSSLFVLLSIFTSLALAGSNEALPPDLQVVDNYLGEPNWLQSFGKPQTMELTFQEITGEKTDSSTPYQIHTELIDPNTVKVSNLDKSGQLSSSFDLQHADWQKQNGNWIRLFIARSESFGFKVVIDQITKSTEQVEMNGTKITVDALQVRTSGKNQMGWVITQNYVISNKLRGLGQLLLREETQSILGKPVRRSHQVLGISER